MKGSLQLAAKREVSQQLAARDETTCRQYAEHCGLWADNDLIVELCFGVITGTRDFLAMVSVVAPDLGAALRKLDAHIEHYRKEFIEEEAENRIKAAEALEDARSDLDVEYRRLA